MDAARPAASYPIIGYYHRVQPWASDPSRRSLGVDPGALRRHARLAKSRGLSLAGVSDAVAMGHGVAAALTFDDGFADNLEHGVPALAAEGAVGTVYVVVSMIGRTPEAGAGHSRMLDVAELRSLVSVGWEIGSHTLSHPRLSELPESRQRTELCESRRRLEDLLGTKVRSLAYPYGVHSADTVRIAEEAGYETAVTTAKRGGGTGPFDIPRLSLGGYGARALKQELKLRWHLRGRRPFLRATSV